MKSSRLKIDAKNSANTSACRRDPRSARATSTPSAAAHAAIPSTRAVTLAANPPAPAPNGKSDSTHDHTGGYST
jgi:hypothetical protein